MRSANGPSERALTLDGTLDGTLDKDVRHEFLERIFLPEAADA